MFDLREQIKAAIAEQLESGALSHSGIVLTDPKRLLQEIDGKREFFVRKAGPRMLLSWRKAHDFDRLEAFTDDERVGDEVVFKLVYNPALRLEVATGGEEEFDERAKHEKEGFDCYSIYKHADNSYEWRLCRIVEKELRYAEDRDMRNLSDKMAREADAQSVQSKGTVNSVKVLQDNAREASERFLYQLQFLHLRQLKLTNNPHE